MTKQTGMIITIVVAVLTLCCSSFCCLFGAGTLLGGGEWSTELGVPETGQIDPVYGVPVICLGILLWVVPVLLWLFLVRGKENAVEEYAPEDYTAEDYTTEEDVPL
jgi:hypothetical protein